MHLLKQSSKPIPQERKRRKIQLAGTLSQYKEACQGGGNQPQQVQMNSQEVIQQEEMKNEEGGNIDEMSAPADNSLMSQPPKRRAARAKAQEGLV